MEKSQLLNSKCLSNNIICLLDELLPTLVFTVESWFLEYSVLQTNLLLPKVWKVLKLRYKVNKSQYVYKHMLFISYGKCLVLGYVEAAHMSDFTFENQRRTFTSYGEHPKYYSQTCTI